MVYRIFIFLFLVVLNSWGAAEAFINKDTQIPSSNEAFPEIRFCVTRSVDGPLKSSLLKQLKTIFGIRSFVETGTYLGDTTSNASAIFDEIHTIELSKELYLKALQRFKDYKNVVVHHGDSGAILKDVLPNIEGRILFYLDGHYSGHVTAKGVSYTPVLEELEAIENTNKSDSVILIDDIRVFQDSCFPEKPLALDLGLGAYPDLKDLIVAIFKINPTYQICFLGDALLAFPEGQEVSVSPVVRACALHRLESLCVNLSEEELKHADEVIGKAAPDETEEMGIYYQIYSPFEIEYGYRCYSCLWQALILREHGKELEVRSLLRKAAENSKSDWSLSRFMSYTQTNSTVDQGTGLKAAEINDRRLLKKIEEVCFIN